MKFHCMTCILIYCPVSSRLIVIILITREVTIVLQGTMRTGLQLFSFCLFFYLFFSILELNSELTVVNSVSNKDNTQPGVQQLLSIESGISIFLIIVIKKIKLQYLALYESKKKAFKRNMNDRIGKKRYSFQKHRCKGIKHIFPTDFSSVMYSNIWHPNPIKAEQCYER